MGVMTKSRHGLKVWGGIAARFYSLRDLQSARLTEAPSRLTGVRTPQVKLVHPNLPVVGYVILSHQPDLRLQRLVTRIRELDPDARIHVNHNPSGIEAITPQVRAFADSIVLTTGGRGDSSHIRRQLHSSRIALEDPAVDYVVAISGEDYPCANLLSARHELIEASDGFIDHVPALDPVASTWPRREMINRYHYRWRTIFRHGPRMESILHPLHAVNYLQPFLLFNTVYGGLRVGWCGNPPPEGLRLHTGTAWTCMSRRAVDTVDSALHRDSPIAHWASGVLVADEAIVPSIVANAPELKVSNQSKFYADFFQSRRGRPAYLEIQHLAAILASGAWFCRKVSSSDFMDALDNVTERSPYT